MIRALSGDPVVLPADGEPVVPLGAMGTVLGPGAVPVVSFYIDGTFAPGEEPWASFTLPRLHRVTVVLRPKEPRRIKKIRRKIEAGRPLGRRERRVTLRPRAAEFDAGCVGVDFLDEAGRVCRQYSVTYQPVGPVTLR